MQVLAMDHGVNVNDDKVKQLLEEDVAHVWQLIQIGTVRQVYQRLDQPFVVIILEVDDLDEARRVTDQIPFVKHRITAFDLIPVGPFDGLNVLMADRTSSQLPSRKSATGRINKRI